VGALVAFIRLTTTLVELDLSSNSFGPAGCEQLRRAVELNTSLQVSNRKLGTAIHPIQTKQLHTAVDG